MFKKKKKRKNAPNRENETIVESMIICFFNYTMRTFLK